MKIFYSQQKKGFVILFAVLMAGVIALMTYSIFSVTQKSLILSSLAAESQLSFYAADAGVECALYLDQRVRVFSSSPLEPFFGCNGYRLDDLGKIDSVAGSSSTSYRFVLPTSFSSSDKGQCALINVTKFSSSTAPRTIVESRGYNSCLNDFDGSDTEPFWADPGLVERRLEVQYLGI